MRERSAPAKQSGKIKFFNNQKGYGFISADNGSEYFAHINQVRDNILPVKGDRVLFELDKDRIGRLRAQRIVVLGARP